MGGVGSAPQAARSALRIGNRVRPAVTEPAIAGGSAVRSDYLIFGSPLIGEEEIAEIVATLRSGWIGTGPRTERFEADFKAYVGSRHAIAVSSCTAALHLSLVAAGIGPGDDVVVPAMTFVATANSVVHAGARPVLCDVDPITQNVTVELVERVLTPATRVIMPVHLGGRPVDMTGLRELARRRKLLLVSDAAHAIEACHRGQNVARLGDVTAYSFYPTKNVTTGEGGMIATDSDMLAERLRRHRLHGLSAESWKRFSSDGFKHYEAMVLGYKYNMTDMQAALGLPQLARIERTAARRREIWARYDDAFADAPLQRPAAVPAGDRHASHLYSVLLDLDALRADRDTIAHALHLEGIGTGVHYRGVHLQPFYREMFGFEPESFPNATWISDRTLSLPLSAKLNDDDVDDVIFGFRRVLRYYRR